MAGIYISGMEIPKVRDTLVLVKTNGTAIVYEDEAYVTTAVPVPDHGRLGDLDRILEIIDGIWDCNDMVFKPNDHCCDVPKDCHGCKWAETKRAIREIVVNAPTVIQADKEGEA